MLCSHGAFMVRIFLFYFFIFFTINFIFGILLKNVLAKPFDANSNMKKCTSNSFDKNRHQGHQKRHQKDIRHKKAFQKINRSLYEWL